MSEIRLDVAGYPPAKGEALSMLGPRHPHASRVLTLIEAAKTAAESGDVQTLGSSSIGLEMVLRCPRDGNRSDATNYLGGVGDVLESKGHRGQLGHLGELARVALYDNDRQIEEVHYRWEPAGEPSYSLRFWTLDR